MGHINYGHGIFDPKGLTGAVTLNGATLAAQWTVTTLPFEAAQLARVSWQATPASPTAPALFRGTWTIPSLAAIADTWWSSRGWGKGFVVVNGVNIGRYWDAMGPQHALFIAAPLLVVGSNEIIVFEQEAIPAAGAVATFVAGPDLSLSAPGGASHHADSRRSAPAGTASAPAAAACQTPYLGQILTLQTCATTPSAGAQWTLDVTVPGVNAGRYRLSSTSAGPLCMALNGTNPASGYPYLILDACAGAGDGGDPRRQDWLTFDALGGGRMSVTTGLFFDITGGGASPGAIMEGYPSNGNAANQRWSWQPSSGWLISAADSSLCIAAC